MKIVILDKATVTQGDVQLTDIERLGEVVYYDLTTPEQVVERIKDAHIVLCNKVVFTREIMEQATQLKYIGLFATGYNNIDVKAANELNITVCNVPSYSTDAVAQHTFAFILGFLSNVSEYSESVKQRDWINSKTFSYFPFELKEIKGLTLGIIGYGSIGQRVSNIAKAFGMNVIVYTRTQRDSSVEYVSFEETLKRSDILTIHCPLTEHTKELINKQSLEQMKPTAYLINTSRGGVICENDLADALNKGVIAGAGLDVLTIEPMESTNPLVDSKNCIITPHIAWAPKQTRERLIKVVVSNIENFVNGTPVNTVI